nr:hypothetical protein [Streptomyces rimosus]
MLAPASATAAPERPAVETGQPVGPTGEMPQPKSAGAVELDAAAGCAAVQSRLDGYAEQGVETVGCIDQTPAEGDRTETPAASKAAAARPGAEQVSAGAKCSAVVGQWYYTRLDACGSAKLTYDVIDTRTKKKIGGATFTAKQEYVLEAKSGSWKTDVSLKQESAWGEAKALRASWKTECIAASACAAGSAWQGAQPIATGKTLHGGTSHQWKAGQNIEGFRTKTTVTVLGAGQVLLSPATFEPPGKMTIRCDKTASGTSVGCVFPSFAPTLVLPLNHRGHVNVAWSMQYLTDHWGWEGKGSPLTREADDAVSQANRGKVCDSAFTKDPTVPDDSCDEFPFAATNQSGAQLGLSGKDCAQIRPDMPANGRYTVTYVNNTSGRRCTIGHVPNKENGSVGGSLSSFYQNNRVLNDEKFWLAVQ